MQQLLSRSFILIIILNFSCIAVWEEMNRLSLNEIKRKGKLKVITAYNANSYFIYKDQPIGYEYELLKLLTKDLGVELDIEASNDLANLDYKLNSGEGDLLAANTIVTREKGRQLKFTEHLMTTTQVLVQRKKGFIVRKKMTEYIDNSVDLIGKTVHVRANSDNHIRLKKLQEELGGTINIKTITGNITIDELIEQVYSGEIDYTVADEQTALINNAYYSEIDISLPISFPQKIAWVVRRNSPELLEYVNNWIEKNQSTIKEIQDKYYRKSRTHMYELKIESKPKNKSHISAFDAIIKEQAAVIGWDWRFLAALIHQESRFNPNARSWMGASGLMQLMPSTAQSLGVSLSEIHNPRKNITAGVKHLKYLDGMWKKSISDDEERVKFVLASYNAGQGHVMDAMTLARFQNKSSTKWDKNVAEAILLLSDPAYYNGYGVKYGYCRGLEPYKYVQVILAKYNEYRETVKK
ncbi:MAG: transporter substrate-binding domain-containing protein [Leptospiraceae bacterium]|nr:transporter substrate-binding domain-containing protein [Leptospiraceae bacterium]